MGGSKEKAGKKKKRKRSEKIVLCAGGKRRKGQRSTAEKILGRMYSVNWKIVAKSRMKVDRRKISGISKSGGEAV